MISYVYICEVVCAISYLFHACLRYLIAAALSILYIYLCTCISKNVICDFVPSVNDAQINIFLSASLPPFPARQFILNKRTQLCNRQRSCFSAPHWIYEAVIAININNYLYASHHLSFWGYCDRQLLQLAAVWQAPSVALFFTTESMLEVLATRSQGLSKK